MDDGGENSRLRGEERIEGGRREGTIRRRDKIEGIFKVKDGRQDSEMKAD